MLILFKLYKKDVIESTCLQIPALEWHLDTSIRVAEEAWV